MSSTAPPAARSEKKTDQQRDARATTYLTQVELARLQEQAKLAGATVSTYVRAKVIR